MREGGRKERFCLYCGTPLAIRLESGRERPMCPSCGWVFYRNPVPAAAAIALIAGKVVLVKRRDEPGRGLWCLPSGFEEDDETPEEAAVRETREETGLEIRVRSLYNVYYSDSYPGKRTLVAVYATDVVGGEMRAGAEAEEVRAFPLDEIPEDIAFLHHRRVIEDLKKGRVPI